MELIYDIEESGLAHAKDAVEVFHVIVNTIDKVVGDFMNAPNIALFENHFEATYKATWSLLAKSTK
ncbi:hypothetical protein D3C84_629660 [compost metagenome]